MSSIYQNEGLSYFKENDIDPGIEEIKNGPRTRPVDVFMNVLSNGRMQRIATQVIIGISTSPD